MKIATLKRLAVVAGVAACAAPKASAGPAPEPKLPVSAFIDSTGLHQALLAAPPAPPEFLLKPLFTVRYDSTGALQEVRTISTRGFPPAYAERMVELLRAHVRPRIAAAKPSWNHVWLRSGSTPMIAVLTDMAEVRPEVVNARAITNELERASERLEGPMFQGRRLTARVSLRVNEDGMPEEVKIDRSSGSVDVDREVYAVARTMRFKPAQLEGYIVSTLVSLPITIDFPRPNPNPSPTPRRP